MKANRQVAKVGQFLIALAIAFCWLGEGRSAWAQEHLGPSSDIVEPDMKEAILKRLREKEKSGELAKLQREAAARAKKQIEEPTVVSRLGRTDTPRTYYYDPTLVQRTAIRDPSSGREIVPAGTRVNPLEYVTLATKLLFFDGSDPDQVKKAMALIERDRDGYKPILVAGRPVELTKKKKVWMYFDQGGTLINRFKIKQVPAIVSQDGYRLRIDEIRAIP